MGAGKTKTAYNKAEDEDEITPIHPLYSETNF
jgi:hypothetical protein